MNEPDDDTIQITQVSTIQKESDITLEVSSQEKTETMMDIQGIEVNENPGSHEKERQVFSYEEDLQDSLHVIQANFKRGTHLLQGFSHFCRNFNRVMQTFSHGMLKCGEIFEKEMLDMNNLDTTTIAVTSLKNGFSECSKAI